MARRKPAPEAAEVAMHGGPGLQVKMTIRPGPLDGPDEFTVWDLDRGEKKIVPAGERAEVTYKVFLDAQRTLKDLERAVTNHVAFRDGKTDGEKAAADACVSRAAWQVYRALHGRRYITPLAVFCPHAAQALREGRGLIPRRFIEHAELQSLTTPEGLEAVRRLVGMIEADDDGRWSADEKLTWIILNSMNEVASALDYSKTHHGKVRELEKAGVIGLERRPGNKWALRHSDPDQHREAEQRARKIRAGRREGG